MRTSPDAHPELGRVEVLDVGPEKLVEHLHQETLEHHGGFRVSSSGSGTGTTQTIDTPT